MAKILIADDDDDMVEICSRLLSRKGHDLLVVRNAEAAVRTATSERPDLILMDMRMPTADDGKISDRAGLDATVRLKADPATAAIPILALTGHTMHKWKEAILAAGCAQLLDKPIVDFAVLLGAIDRHLRPQGHP